MSFDWKRWKRWDFVVMALFVLIIIGLSLTWWSYDAGGSVDDAIQQALDASGMTMDELDALGIDVDELVQQYAGDIGVDTGVSGWKFNSLVFVFIFSLLALLVVALKAFLPINRPLPGWYREGLGIMVLGGIMTLISFLRIVVPPEGGHGVWDPGAGAYITLIASVVTLLAGYMMWKDKSMEYGSATLPKFTTNTGAPAGYQQPPAGYQQPPAGYQPPAAPAAGGKFCANCGGPLGSEDAACKNCGKPV